MALRYQLRFGFFVWQQVPGVPIARRCASCSAAASSRAYLRTEPQIPLALVSGLSVNSTISAQICASNHPLNA